MNRFPRPQRGITLTETSVAMSIAAAAVTASVSSFGELRARHELEGVANELRTDIQLVRSEAVARNRTLRLSFYADAGGSCYVIHTGSPADCSCGTAAPTQCTGDAQMVKSVWIDAQRGLGVTANRSSMVFDSVRGTVSPTATVRVVGANGLAIDHVVNIMGRTRSCAVGDHRFGLAPCA